MRNFTRNQHFISQAEQCLNAINPTAKKKNKKIFGFEVINANYLGQAKALSIQSSLCEIDLYSFSLLEDKARLNFESEFGRYESEIGKLTDSLLLKLDAGCTDLHEEIQRIFILKFLNTLRNPYCVQNTLKIFGKYSSYEPTDTFLKGIYFKIENDNKPHIHTLCQRFGILESDYVNWLKILYLILYVRDEDGYNMLESIVKNFYTNPNHLTQVYISRYTKGQSVLLSDKGFNTFNPMDISINYEFNLDYKSHIAFSFTNVSNALTRYYPDGNESLIELFKSTPRNINLILETDNNKFLSAYNTRTVVQASKMVFCKYSTKPILEL